MKLFPLKDGTHNWGTPEESLKNAKIKEDSLYLQNIIPVLADAMQKGNEVERETDKGIDKCISVKIC